MGKTPRREPCSPSSGFSSRLRLGRDKREIPGRGRVSLLSLPGEDGLGDGARARAEAGNERRGTGADHQLATARVWGRQSRRWRWLLKREMVGLFTSVHGGDWLVEARGSMDPFLQSMLNDNINCTQASLPLPDVPNFSPGWSDSNGADSGSGKGKKKKAVPKTSRKTWKAGDEELLMSAWLNVSQDSVVGTDQSAETYWGNIMKYCDENATANWTPRSEKGLINHWSTISADSSKFSSYMAKVHDIHPSGTTQENSIAMAMKMFKEIEGRSFGFLHLWSILSQHPKWCAHIDARRQKTDYVSSVRSSAVGQDSICGVPDDLMAHGDRELPRPIGRDGARKARARGPNGSTSSVSGSMYKDVITELNKHKAELVQLWREEVSIMRRTEEDKIMAMDISNMDEASRDYFSRRKAEIISRRFGHNIRKRPVLGRELPEEGESSGSCCNGSLL